MTVEAYQHVVLDVLLCVVGTVEQITEHSIWHACSVALCLDT